jgi:ankyrin repeat protein
LLIDKKANIHATDSRGWTELHLAAQSGHLEVVKMLIDVHRDLVPLKDIYARSALDYAESMGYDEIRLLLSTSRGC